MDLKDFFAIFIIHKKIFWGIIVITVICSAVVYFVQGQTYKTSLTLNVTRDAAPENNEYSYDSFYRLQADERFADTVVRWTQSAHIVKSVFGNMKNSSLVNKNKFNAKRLSSQVVDVTFSTVTEKQAKSIAKKLITALNQESQKLNIQQNQKNWFVILGSEPVITDNKTSFMFLMSLGVFVGFFIAFWTVMIRHYMID
jgi:uncharacterized protein involved in exopolysaccharide biosynthesis